MLPSVKKPPHSQQTSIDEMFAARSISLTRQRRAIWEYFATAGRASTVAEAAEALRTHGIGQSTVYRAVSLLTELGLLVRVHVGGDAPCYAAPPVGHMHPLICGACRKIIDFDGEGDLNYLERQLETTTGVAIYGHHLEVYGICPECSAARGRPASTQDALEGGGPSAADDRSDEGSAAPH
jgi:Fe2+ or Zn2+ uptake regulation protein